MELTKAHRNLISRGTLLVVGIVLLYAGYVVFANGNEARAYWVAKQQTLRDNGIVSRQRDSSGAGYFWLFGILLFGTGGISTGLAVVPTGWLSRVSVAPTTGKSFD